jgi:predicted deacylase
VGAVHVEPGTKAKLDHGREGSFEGGYLDFPIFAARGARPGPALCVTSAIHGDENNSVEIARRAFASVDAEKLAGTLIVLPTINASGFRTGDRYMPDRRDLNRFFPGDHDGSVAAIVADAVFRLITHHCNYVIDLHTGSDERSNAPQIRVDAGNEKALDMATHFGVGLIVAEAGPEGSLRRETMNAGIPAIIYEAGPPLVFHEPEIERGTQGVMNVLDRLGMFETVEVAQHAGVLRSSHWIRVPRGGGGVFLPSIALGAKVKKGQLLATVTDPLTDEVHEIRAEGDGVVIGISLPRIVLSGYGVFHIGDVVEDRVPQEKRSTNGRVKGIPTTVAQENPREQ